MERRRDTEMAVAAKDRFRYWYQCLKRSVEGRVLLQYTAYVPWPHSAMAGSLKGPGNDIRNE